MTMITPGSLIEENLERVIDSVVRNVSAGRGAVPDLDATESQAPGGEARATLADLCGHVAYALRSLDAAPHVLAGYKAPVPAASPPTLNLVR